MRIGVCAREPDRGVIRKGMHAYGLDRGWKIELEEFSRPEDLLYRMRERRYDAVFVALEGALGMELAMSVREADEKVLLVWASDDRNFGVMSYRLRARLFCLLPISEKQVSDALDRCVEREPELYGFRR